MNKLRRYHICILFVILLCISAFNFVSYSLSVASDPRGIYCIKDNGLRAVSEWVTIDFEGDYYFEYYYFNNEGYLITNSITPDGYLVNERGQWVENGIVQRLPYTLPKASEKNTKSKQLAQTDNSFNSNNNYPLLFMLAILIYIFLLSIIKWYKSRKRHNSHYTRKSNFPTKQNNYYKENTNSKTTVNDTTIQRDFWWNFKSSTDKRGDEGEDEVAYVLKSLDNNFIVLRNINLPRKDKDPVQIDFICVSNKGLFVIEVKNWLGYVTGDYESDIWYSSINGTNNKQKNPIKQNEWHVDYLKRFIKQNIGFYSIIVFTNRSDLSYLDSHYGNSYVVNINQLINLLYTIYKNSNVIPYNNYKRIAGYLKGFENNQ